MELEIYSPSKDGFVKEITWNHEAIKAEVAEKVRYYTNLIYTDEQIQGAKADRAKLRKFIEALEAKRKEIKKQCLAPYESFEKQMKEIIAIVNEPVLLIDGQIKDFESIRKAEKKEAIKAYWHSLLAGDRIPAGINFDHLFNEKMLNASVSMKAVCAEIDARLAQIEKDLATLAEMPEFAFEAAEVYKTTLDINRAIAEGKRLSEMQKRKAEAERLKAEQEAAEKAKATAPVPNPEPVPDSAPVKTISEPKDTEKEEFKKWVTFTALLSLDDAKALKEFFTERNIEFKAVRG